MITGSMESITSTYRKCNEDVVQTRNACWLRGADRRRRCWKDTAHNPDDSGPECRIAPEHQRELSLRRFWHLASTRSWDRPCKMPTMQS